MQKLNSEFNYRYQVKGETPWERLKILKGFLEGRERVIKNIPVYELKRKAKKLELELAKQNNSPEHIILNLEAEVMEIELFSEEESEGIELTRQEIEIIKTLMQELYDIVEPTRLKHDDGTPYSDEQMFEINAANEFTAMIGKEMYTEIIANGRPSPAKILNAMSNPYTFNTLKKVGLIPNEANILEPNVDPLKIELNMKIYDKIEPPVPSILELQTVKQLESMIKKT